MTDDSDLGSQFARMISVSGPLSILQYMGEANARYYASRDPLGTKGDFITAPEISQIFGELVGLWLTDLWVRAKRPGNCHLVELGPGRGTLASDAMRVMHQFGFRPKLHLVETSPKLRALQAQKHRDASWHDAIETLPTFGPLLIIANEFFDALPIRQMVATHNGWRERVVVREGGKFLPIPGARPMDAIVPDAFRNAPPGTILETCPGASAIAFEIARRLFSQGGAMLAVDYGYTEARAGSSLQAVSGHAAADPFDKPGEHDLTAHVNFAELAQIGRAGNLKVFGPVAQGDWLSRIGIYQRGEALILDNPGARHSVEQAVHRLVDPQAMGDLFKALAYVSHDWPGADGFAAN